MKLAISRSISTQLTLLTCGIVAVAVTIISAVAYLRSAAALDRRWNEDLATQVRLVEMQFETFDTVARENAERLLHVFQNMLGGAVRVDDTRTMQVGGHAAPLVTGAGGVLNLDFSQVDAFARMTGGTATVFARVGDDFLRVTTSLKKQDGTRALGTFLGKGHPGYQKLLRGEGFGGRAKLFGREYMTQYLPVRDGSGRTTAILYVGFDMTGAMNALFEGISRHRVGEGGYYFVIDALNKETGGELRVHPQAVGKAVDAAPELTPFADVLRQQKGMFTNGGELYVFQDFPDWKLTFGATIGLDELRAEAAWMRNVSLLSGLLVIALGCALTYFVVTRKLKPLADLARDAERIGAGDLTVRSALEATDEIGEVAGAFNRMADQVQELVLRMKRLVDGLKAAVNSVRTESERVREGSESQSEAASRAAAALEEVTASLGHVSENARDSRRLSERTNELSEQGQSVAERAAGETAAIATTVREAADRIAALSERSDQISEVVKVIKDIADQTNLLALNAAIEAARAGEQGRGFAVVADEVRKLAERTSQATIEIGTMISSIQTETGGAVQGMETSSGRVEEGVRLVREALEALQEIRRAAAETCEKAGEISHAMTEQSAASTEISSNVENIAEMAERNTTAALRNQDTVRELETLATDLVALTARLRVA